MIKALIFDFGNVFLNLDLEKAKKDVFDLLRITSFSEDMLEINKRYEQGLITTDNMLDFYLEEFPYLTELDIIQSWNAVLKDFPKHRLTFLQKLASEKRFKLILLSNTNALHINWVKENVSFYETFKTCFDAFYLSHEIGLRKPNKAIFEFVLNNHNLKADQCLFIDDTTEHILAASQLGIHTWNINPKLEDITDLLTIQNHLF